MAQDLAQDVLRAVFAHLNCVELARCVSVCRNWGLAAQCGQLWKQQLLAEFGLNQCTAQAEHPYELFQACLRSPCTPFVSDIVRFSSLMDSIEAGVGWELYIKQLWEQSHVGGSNSTTPADDMMMMHHDLLVESTRLTPTAITRNVQSVWISFTLPQWVGRVSDVTTGMRNHLQLVANGVAASPTSTMRGRRPSPKTTTWEVVVMDEVSFKMPQNETELLLLSHTDGLYAWEEAGVLHLVVYIHCEHLLPVAFKQLAGIWPNAGDTSVFGHWGAMGVACDKPAAEATSKEPKTVVRSGWNTYMPPRLTSPVMIPTHYPCSLKGSDKLAVGPNDNEPKASISSSDDASGAASHSCIDVLSNKMAGQLLTVPGGVAQHNPRFAVMLHLDFSQLGKADSHSFAILLVSKQPGQFIGQDGVELEACSVDGYWKHVRACRGIQPSQQHQQGSTREVETRLMAALQLCASAGLPCPHTTLLSKQLLCSEDTVSSSAPRSDEQDKAQSDMMEAASCVQQLRACLHREGMLDFSLYPVGYVDQMAPANSDHVTHACHETTGSCNKQHVADDVEGRLTIGRCGVEVWQGDSQHLPASCLATWNSFAQSSGVVAQQQQSSQFASGSQNPAAAAAATAAAAAADDDDGVTDQLFEMYMANFMVDGVQQPLWANKLQFLLPHISDGTSAETLHPFSPWGLIRLNMTREAALMLWGRPKHVTSVYEKSTKIHRG